MDPDERYQQAREERSRKIEAAARLRVAKTKICRICHHEYPRNELYFYPRTDAQDGYRPRCIQCYRSTQTGI